MSTQVDTIKKNSFMFVVGAVPKDTEYGRHIDEAYEVIQQCFEEGPRRSCLGHTEEGTSYAEIIWAFEKLAKTSEDDVTVCIIAPANHEVYDTLQLNPTSKIRAEQVFKGLRGWLPEAPEHADAPRKIDVMILSNDEFSDKLVQSLPIDSRLTLLNSGRDGVGARFLGPILRAARHTDFSVKSLTEAMKTVTSVDGKIRPLYRCSWVDKDGTRCTETEKRSSTETDPAMTSDVDVKHAPEVAPSGSEEEAEDSGAEPWTIICVYRDGEVRGMEEP
jgi:hypothetical protein